MKKFFSLIILAVILQTAASAQPAGAHRHTMHKRHSRHARHRKSGTYTRHHIRVNNDSPNAPYQGKPSRANDGVQRNKQRNMNYQNNGERLPPNNGNNSH